jgi:hypothetical protein
MNDDAQPAVRLADLSPETRLFLSSLSRDDLQALERAIPLIKRLFSFGIVAKWLILSVIAVIIGASTLWDGVSNLLKHIRTP